ncbi:MAG TPA: 3-methyl-2-oxobutanoate hydroxymethyltransferase, partial [Burkholderiaceae bacterium]|nr:3-methyl-2-oxobutanoate hydroxymethyltransferase [Burkholderiaceae bacterium]
MSVHPSGGSSSVAAAATSASARPTVSLPRLREMAARGEKIAMLTCYDATFAKVLDGAGVDALLVGDSLGNVVQGQPSTLPVSLAHMAYHTECVARAQTAAWLIADLPFGCYEASAQQAFDSAVTLMRAGARMVIGVSLALILLTLWR